MHYKGPLSKSLSQAFESGEVWYTTLRDAGKRERAERRRSQVPWDKQNRVITDAEITSWDKQRAHDGYTLIGFDHPKAAYLIDMNGDLVHQWRLSYDAIWPDPMHVHQAVKARPYIRTAKVLPDGSLLAVWEGLADTPYGYGLVKIDKDSNVVWKYNENAHHDFYVAENGEIIALIHKFLKEPVPGTESLPYPLLADYIVRLSPDGKELDRISVLEAFRDSPFFPILFHDINGGFSLWDAMHTNHVVKLEDSLADKFPMFKPGALLITMKVTDAIAVIDPDTRKVVWAHNGLWKRPHDGHFLSNGRILVFDNQGHIQAGKTFSRAIEIDPKTLGVSWFFAGNPEQPFYTAVCGRAQRLSNGNTLLTEAKNTRLIEVTPDGKIVWSFAYRFPGKPRGPSLLTAIRYNKNELPFLEQSK